MEEINTNELQTVIDSIEEQGEQIEQILQTQEDQQEMTEEMTLSEEESNELITTLQEVKYSVDASNELAGSSIMFCGVLSGILLATILYNRIRG